MPVNIHFTMHTGQPVSPAALTRTRKALAGQMLTDMEKLVPKREGNLRNDAIASIDGSKLIYTVPYASDQFYGMNGGKYPIVHYTTPGTGKRWDLRGKSLFMSQWLLVVQRGLTKYGS